MEKRQFSLKKMFQMTTVIAILLAFAAPNLRALLEGQGLFVTLGVCHATFLGILIGFRILHRDRTKTVGGKLLYRTPRYTSSQLASTKLLDWLFFATAFAYLVLMTAIPVVRLKLVGVLMLFVHPLLLLPQYLFFDKAARTIVAWIYRIDQHSVEVYENGYCLNTFRFNSFDEIIDVKPNRETTKIDLTFDAATMQGRVTKTIVVPIAHRDAIADAMKSACSDKSHHHQVQLT